jgi:hypothetical protein
MAKASLQENWRLAEQAGLDQMSEEDIDTEIAQVRMGRHGRKTG